MQGTYQELSNSELDFGKLMGSVDEDSDSLEDAELEDVADEEIPFIDGVKGESQKLLKSTNSISGRGSMSCAVSKRRFRLHSKRISK